MEPADAKRMDHAVGAAGQHHIDFAGANHLGRLADRLAARGTRRDAVGVRPLGIEAGRQMRGRHVQFQFQFVVGAPQPQRLFGEFFLAEFAHLPSIAP